jgi:hypothetical protein
LRDGHYPPLHQLCYFMSQPSFTWIHCFIIIHVPFEIFVYDLLLVKKVLQFKSLFIYEGIGFPMCQS